MPKQKKSKKSVKELDLEKKIKLLQQKLKQLKSQNQSDTKKPANEILKNDFRDVISPQMPEITQSGEPIYKEIFNNPTKNFHDVILRYKVKNYESNDSETYLNKISEWIKEKASTYNKYINLKDKTAELPDGKILNFEGIKFPFKYIDIPKFECLNTFLIINIFGIKEFTFDKIEPITQMSKEEKEYNIDLLLSTNETNSRYILITKLANLIKNKNHKNYNYVCRNCLNLFKSESAKNNHFNQCKKNSSQRIKLPENKEYKFQKYYMKSKIPFIIEFDFESTLTKLQTFVLSEKKVSYEL